MSKWEKKFEDILKAEKDKHLAIYDLDKRLYKEIHGFHPIDKSLIESLLKEEIDKTSLIDSKITEYVIEPRFKGDSENSCLLIKVFIKGDFNGYVEIKTGSGSKNTNEGKIDIYYVMLSDHKVVSEKYLKVKEMYKNYQKYTVENIIDIALNNSIFLEYEDCYKNYTIWHKEPSQYGDSIHGEISLFDENRDYKRYKRFHDNLNSIHKFKDVREYADEVLFQSNQSTTYEWVEYKL